MRHLFVATIAASALLVSACAEEPEVAEVDETVMTEPMMDPAVEPVATWDSNSDGMFQEAEYTAWNQQGVTAWDTDGDGMLNQNEFNAGWENTGFRDGGAVFTAWDDDADGFINNDEFFDDEEWTEWDADASGSLETTEFAYY